VNVKTGELLADRYKIPTPEVATPKEIVAHVKELLNHFSWKDGPVGIGFPNRLHDNVSTGHGNMHPKWQGKNLKVFFEGNLKQPVQVLNDADAAGLAEIKFGAGKGIKGLVIICTFGTGIGSAMFYDGKLLPNSELGQLTYKKKKYELYAADSIRKNKELTYEDWGKRVNKFFNHVEMLLSPQLFIIGGGASKKIELFEDAFDFETPYVPAEMLNVAGTVGAALGYLRKVKTR